MDKQEQLTSILLAILALLEEEKLQVMLNAPQELNATKGILARVAILVSNGAVTMEKGEEDNG